eukprot:5006325-Karenia_brevis.AAC.1
MLTREGGFSGASKALTKGAPLGHTSCVRNQLQERHPSNPTPPSLSNSGQPGTGFTPELEVEDLDRAIRSFHRLAAAGPSGFRPGHLQEAIKTCVGDEVLEHTKTLVCLLIRGGAPRELAPFLAGANLIALPKKDGTVRPIAV